MPAQIQGPLSEGVCGGQGTRGLQEGQSFRVGLGQSRLRVAPWNSHSLLGQDLHGGVVCFAASRQTPQGTQPREPLRCVFTTEPTTAQEH